MKTGLHLNLDQHRPYEINQKGLLDTYTKTVPLVCRLQRFSTNLYCRNVKNMLTR